jgi:predicted enzyme related to lactoylglutathione lyase
MERTKTGEFNWVDLSARDFDGQGAFYEALFGWSHTDVPFAEGMVYRMFISDGHTVGGMSQLAPDMIEHGQPSAWNTYVATDDIDATAAKAAELGGTVVMPPMDVTGFGRMAAVQDPTGAYIFFWKPLRHDETMEYLLPGMLSWNDLTTRDPEAAVGFYTKLLDWDVQRMTGLEQPYWQVSIDGEGEGGIMPMPEMVPAEVPAFWMPYFGTTDVVASVAKAKELGATVQAEPTEVGGMLIFAVLADPAGATFALLQPLGAPGM